MSCCPPYKQSFSGVSVAAVPYGDSMRTKYGIAPNIQVFIYSTIQAAYIQLQYSVKEIVGDLIELDFGGVGTGFIKIF